MPPTGIPSLPAAVNVTPADCALVIALPLDRERFLHDLSHGPRSNFAHAFQRGSSGELELPPEEVWRNFQPFADHARLVISGAARLGVHIVQRATLKDFLEVLPRFKATTLFAHYRSALFFPEDILVVPNLLMELWANNSPPLRRIDETVDGDLTSLVTFLNNVIAPERHVPAEKKEPGQLTEEQMAWHERRKKLEMLLSKVFQEGAGVEFADGWHSVDEIEDAIPSNYSGALDLTVCNSTVLAEKIRRKCPRSAPLANEQEASTHFRFAVYRLVLRELKRKPQPYEDAAFALRQRLVSSMRQKLFEGIFMGKLRSILAKYSVVAPRMGEASGASAGPAWNMKQLRADLREVSRRNASLAWICIAMLIALFLVNCGFVLKFSDHLDRIKEVSSAIGLGLAGAALLTIKFWKVKVLSDVLLVLAAYMKPEEIQQAMRTLLRS